MEHVWAQMFVAVPKLPSPSEWGWLQTTNGDWEVKWTALPEPPQACHELLRCGCIYTAGVNASRLFYSVRLYVCVEANVTVNEMYDALISIWILKVCQTMSCIVYH